MTTELLIRFLAGVHGVLLARLRLKKKRRGKNYAVTSTLSSSSSRFCSRRIRVMNELHRCDNERRSEITEITAAAGAFFTLSITRAARTRGNYSVIKNDNAFVRRFEAGRLLRDPFCARASNDTREKIKPSGFSDSHDLCRCERN